VVCLGAGRGSASSRAGVDVPVGRKAGDGTHNVLGSCLQACHGVRRCTRLVADLHAHAFCRQHKQAATPTNGCSCSYMYLTALAGYNQSHIASSTSRNKTHTLASHLRRCSCAALNTCFAHWPGGPAAPAPAPLLLLLPPAPPAAASVSRNSAATCAPAAAGGSWNDSVCCRGTSATGRQHHCVSNRSQSTVAGALILCRDLQADCYHTLHTGTSSYCAAWHACSSLPHIPNDLADMHT
jgi:hypothetical protein